MRAGLIAVALMAVAACKQPGMAEILKCEHELGAAEAQAAAARSAQAAAEQKVAALEEKLQVTREELAIAQKAADEAVQSMALADAEPQPGAAGKPAPGRAAARAPARPGDAARVEPLIKVGLSLPTQRDERWVKDKLTMLAEAKRRGVELKVQISDNDAAKQVEQCDALIADHVKVLILAPHDAAKAAVILDRAAKAGVKVISYDRLVTDSARDYYYLSFDNLKVGEMQGEFLTRAVPKGNYVLLAGAPSDNNARLFRQGALKYIRPLVQRGEVKILLDEAVPDWSPAEAQKLCQKALASNVPIDGVLAPNDGTAGGCIQALEAAGLAGKVPVTGQDSELAAAIRINHGTQSMTIFKDTRQLGRRAIEMALDLVQGRPIDTHGQVVSNGKREVPAVLLTPYAVTRDNLDAMLVASGYLNREAVYRQ